MTTLTRSSLRRCPGSVRSSSAWRSTWLVEGHLVGVLAGRVDDSRLVGGGLGARPVRGPDGRHQVHRPGGLAQVGLRRPGRRSPPRRSPPSGRGRGVLPGAGWACPTAPSARPSSSSPRGGGRASPVAERGCRWRPDGRCGGIQGPPHASIRRALPGIPGPGTPTLMRTCCGRAWPRCGRPWLPPVRRRACARRPGGARRRRAGCRACRRRCRRARAGRGGKGRAFLHARVRAGRRGAPW